MYCSVLDVLDRNQTYVNLNPHCEPQLGKRGLYDLIGGGNDSKTRQLALLWVLNLSDGDHSLLDIAERADLCFDMIREAADALVQAGLLKTCERTDVSATSTADVRKTAMQANLSS